MDSLKKLSCRTFLEKSPVGSPIPHDYYPGTLHAWILAWAACLRCPIDNMVLRSLQEFIDHGSCTAVVSTGGCFREQVRFIAHSMGIHYAARGTTRRATDPTCVTICVSSDWSWSVANFVRLSQAQCRRVSLKRDATVKSLTELAKFRVRFAGIEKEFSRRPHLYSCLPWAWQGCCGDCEKVKRLVQQLPEAMYERCFERLVAGGLALPKQCCALAKFANLLGIFMQGALENLCFAFVGVHKLPEEGTHVISCQTSVAPPPSSTLEGIHRLTTVQATNSPASCSHLLRCLKHPFASL